MAALRSLLRSRQTRGGAEFCAIAGDSITSEQKTGSDNRRGQFDTKSSDRLLKNQPADISTAIGRCQAMRSRRYVNARRGYLIFAGPLTVVTRTVVPPAPRSVSIPFPRIRFTVTG